MLIKFEADEDLVDLLKKHTGQKVASKAFLEASQQYLGLLVLNKDLFRDLESVRAQRDAVIQHGERARLSAAAFLDQISQQDIFVS